MLLQDYKLVVTGYGDGQKSELFEVPQDIAEEHNLATQNPDVVQSMAESLRNWQESVLKSLTGADYK